jgi:hypothetical protein
MPASITQANKILEAQVGKTAFGTQVAYVGLSSTTPANGNPPTNITEPSGGSYARVTTSGATWGSASAGSITNAAAITFPTASADWASGSNMTYGILYDASTAGNVIGYGVLTVAKNVLSGDTASIAIGQLTVTIS